MASYTCDHHQMYCTQADWINKISDMITLTSAEVFSLTQLVFADRKFHLSSFYFGLLSFVWKILKLNEIGRGNENQKQRTEKDKK